MKKPVLPGRKIVIARPCSEAVAFECARNIIVDLMAIRIQQIADETSQATPDASRLAGLRVKHFKLAQEHAALQIHHLVSIARIRAKYCALVTTWLSSCPLDPMPQAA